MATKAQAKAAIDNAGIDIKNDIDNILPAGVNIKDGLVNFNPTRYQITLDAGNSIPTADSWFSDIKDNLTTASRPFVSRLIRRKSDVKKRYVIIEAKLTVIITNF